MFYVLGIRSLHVFSGFLSDVVDVSDGVLVMMEFIGEGVRRANLGYQRSVMFSPLNPGLGGNLAWVFFLDKLGTGDGVWATYIPPSSAHGVGGERASIGSGCWAPTCIRYLPWNGEP